MDSPDTKYASVNIDTGEHTPIGEDEPVFTIRGNDSMALAAIDAYAEACSANGCQPQHLSNIINARQRFEDYQQTHPESVKVPD